MLWPNAPTDEFVGVWIPDEFVGVWIPSGFLWIPGRLLSQFAAGSRNRPQSTLLVPAFLVSVIRMFPLTA
jgi:hypothetical protein